MDPSWSHQRYRVQCTARLGYLWCSRETSAAQKPLGDFNDGPKGNRLLDPLFNAALASTFFHRFLSAPATLRI